MSLIGLAFFKPDAAGNRQVGEQAKGRIGRSMTATAPASSTN